MDASRCRLPRHTARHVAAQQLGFLHRFAALAPCPDLQLGSQNRFAAYKTASRKLTRYLSRPSGSDRNWESGK